LKTEKQKLIKNNKRKKKKKKKKKKKRMPEKRINSNLKMTEEEPQSNGELRILVSCMQFGDSAVNFKK
jgi:hypothetical protein